MTLLIIWNGFILLMSFFEELDQSHYFLFSVAMLYFTYLYNQIRPINMSSRITLLLFNIPTIILWYIAFVYNDFLCITPITYETFMSLFFIYTYLMLYFFMEYSHLLRSSIAYARKKVIQRFLNIFV